MAKYIFGVKPDHSVEYYHLGGCAGLPTCRKMTFKVVLNI